MNEKRLIKKIRGYVRIILDYMFEKKYEYTHKFLEFQKEYFNLSVQHYTNVTSLSENPPLYDIYITGSDQVWNTKTVKTILIFICVSSLKISLRLLFSACFSNNKIDNRYKSSIKNDYQIINILV